MANVLYRFKPSLWQRIRYTVRMAAAAWRNAGKTVLVVLEDQDAPTAEDERVRAAEQRARLPHRRIEN